MDRQKIAQKLVKLRGDMPRKEAAFLLKISGSALAMYEQGKRIPKDDIKRRIASVYKTPIEDIFFSDL